MHKRVCVASLPASVLCSTLPSVPQSLQVGKPGANVQASTAAAVARAPTSLPAGGLPTAAQVPGAPTAPATAAAISQAQQLALAAAARIGLQASISGAAVGAPRPALPTTVPLTAAVVPSFTPTAAMGGVPPRPAFRAPILRLDAQVRLPGWNLTAAGAWFLCVVDVAPGRQNVNWRTVVMRQHQLTVCCPLQVVWLTALTS